MKTTATDPSFQDAWAIYRHAGAMLGGPGPKNPEAQRHYARRQREAQERMAARRRELQP